MVAVRVSREEVPSGPLGSQLRIGPWTLGNRVSAFDQEAQEGLERAR